VVRTLHPSWPRNSFRLGPALERVLLPFVVAADAPDDLLRAYASTCLDQQVRLEGWARSVGVFSRFLGPSTSRTAPCSTWRTSLASARSVATFRDGDIWTLDLARPVPNKVTRGSNLRPVWSPDGTRIATRYQGRGIGTFDLEITSVATGSFTTLVEATQGGMTPLDWTRDGQTLIFDQGGIWTIGLGDSRKATPYLQDGARNLLGALVAGRQVAGVCNRPFVVGASRLMAVDVRPGDPPRFGTPRQLFEVDMVAHPTRGFFDAFEYDVAADGSRLLVNRLVSLILAGRRRSDRLDHVPPPRPSQGSCR
jgi:hypothetical protein